MIIHQVYAQILGETVQNMIICDSYEMANYLARATYGDDAFAVDCLHVPCDVEDKYIDGKFYSINPETGVKTMIQSLPTQEEQVQVLDSENRNLQLALTEQYETNIALQKELVNLQMALTEFYEGSKA